MPIVRDRREFPESDTCMLNVSYTDADVKKALVGICRNWGANGLSDTWSENDLRYSFKKLLAPIFTDSAGEYLSKWAFRLALRKKYITESANNNTTYLFADLIVKKAGFR